MASSPEKILGEDPKDIVRIDNGIVTIERDGQQFQLENVEVTEWEKDGRLSAFKAYNVIGHATQLKDLNEPQSE